MARPGWLNDNRNRSFPFMMETVGINTPESGLPTMRQLPDSFIVDCGFITGSSSGFDAETHSIWLNRIYRQSNSIYFEFASDAPILFQKHLTFIRNINEGDYAVEHIDSVALPDESESISSTEAGDCDEPLWSGYLITGAMSDISNRIANGETILRQSGDAVVEPALIQNLNGTTVSSLEVANNDRTRATAVDTCEELVWPHQTGVIFVQDRCVQGDIRWKPGFNSIITQNDFDNSITVGASVGSGEGRPCEEIGLFPGESPPIGSNNSLLSGGFLCDETLRSFNGVGGPVFTFLGGQGVSIIPDPASHCIKIDFNLVDMSLCLSDFSAFSESL